MTSFSTMQKMFNPARSGNRFFGVMVGIVTNNVDPEGMGRIKVRFPWLSDNDESHWARVVSPMAGNNRGFYFLPEVDDEVLIAFEQGLVEMPYIMGSLWNGVDQPPESNANGENNKRTIKSRSGHIIRLDDSDGAEKIEIIDKSTANSIVIDTATNAITITAQGDITMESTQGNVIIKGQNVEIEATAQNITNTAAGNIDSQAGSQCNVVASVINLN